MFLVRVVPGMEETMARFCSIILLNSVDLPALTRPTRVMVGSFLVDDFGWGGHIAID